MKLELLKFAGIDIGSNAVRLLITNVIEEGKKNVMKKSSIIRMPVRLGDSVFTRGIIPEEKVQKLIYTLEAYQKIMQVQEVVQYQCCATSAMREAANGSEVVAQIKAATGMEIEIISGVNEAELIFSTEVTHALGENKTFLFVDVGGGSTECTLLSKRRVIDSESFKIGTLRLLHETIEPGEFNRLQEWLSELIENYPKLMVVGTGGNINRYFKLSQVKEGKPLSYYHLLEMYDNLVEMKWEDRIRTFGLNPDRADVIIPAGELFLNILKWTKRKQIYVPKVGLADGIVRNLYLQHKKQHPEKYE